MNVLFRICLTSLFASSAVQAQVFVSPNSYVYVDNRMVYVKQDIDLQTNGNILLRNEAQLLQGTTGSSSNKGAGKLSVFQEGTVNNFAYNYWCSPVGEANAAPGNSSFSVSMLHQPTDNLNSTPATLLGTGQNGTANPLAIANRWVFKFLSSANYSEWVNASSALPNIGAGEGFTMKGTSGADNSYTDAGQTNNPGSAQRYDFRGKPNDGSILINVGAGKLTLTGNPYPSAIDLKAFLLAATNTTQVAYFWEQDPSTNSHLIASYKGGYGTYSPLASGGVTDPTHGYMGVYLPPTFYAYDGAGTQLGATGTGQVFERRFSPIGQGFMVEGAVNGTATMSNNFRVYMKEGAYSEFNRNANADNSGFLPEIQSVAGWDYKTVSTAPAPQIRFRTLLNNTAVKETALVMIDGASDGAQPGMDAKSPDQTDVDMYFVIDDQPYVISVIDFDAHKRIPIGLKANIPASFRIRAAEMLNFEQAEHVYLHDKLSDMYYDIKNSDYEFTVQPGTNHTQYEITFVDGLLGADDALASDAFAVFQNNDRQMLTVSNPGRLDVQSVTLFDVAGKQIFSKKQLGTSENHVFPTSGLAESVYIVKILTADNKPFAKKISIFHTGK